MQLVRSEIIGIIGHLTDDYIYVFQNKKMGNMSAPTGKEKLNESPFKYAWGIHRKNKNCFLKKSPLTLTEYINDKNVRGKYY